MFLLTLPKQYVTETLQVVYTDMLKFTIRRTQLYTVLLDHYMGLQMKYSQLPHLYNLHNGKY